MSSDSLRSYLVRGAAGTFGLKVAAAGFSFLSGLLLARVLGMAGYGAYAYAIAWVSVLVVPAVFGLDRLLVRTVAASRTQSAWGLMRGLLRWAHQVVVLVSVAVVAPAAFLVWIAGEQFDPHIVPALWMALVLVPMAALALLRQAAMQGFHRVVVGQLPEMLIQPLVFIVSVGAAYLLLGEALNAPWAVGLHAVAAGVALVIGAWLLRTTLPQAVHDAVPVYDRGGWTRSALPLLFARGMQVVNAQTDIILLGAIKGAELAGIYAVATRGAELITFVLVSVNTVLAPAIASLHAAGDMRRLQSVITKSVRVIMVFSLPVALALILSGERFLVLFGQGFTRGATALAILSAGQLMNAAMGSVGLLLIMTGHERDAAMGVGISALVNLVLNALLIPVWGMEGAAAATAISMIIWNLLLAVWVYKRLGIHTTALGQMGVMRRA